MSRRTIPIEKRFWGQVSKKGPNDCWEWLGSKAGTYKEYGRISFNGRADGAHRVSWILHNGPIPDGMDVLHRCDNPGCVNPAHLWLGTHAENMIDKARKGRVVIEPLRGENHPLSKLTPDKVREIRSLSGIMTHREMSREFGVSTCVVSRIINRLMWKHI